MMGLLDFLHQRRIRQANAAWLLGYDWAAGQLLRGDATPQEINARTSGIEDPFDRGAQAALTKLILKGVVQAS